MTPSRVRAALVRAGVVVGLVAGVLAAPGSVGVAHASVCDGIFDAAFHAELDRDHPGQRVTAAVYDTRADCWAHLHEGVSITTASVIKAQFLAGVLLRAQEAGRGLTAWEWDRVRPMMRYSHNPPASDLFTSLGGVSGQEALDERFGLYSTTSTSAWGATSSTAIDRTRLAHRLLGGGGPLSTTSIDTAWSVMTDVHPTQQWGITAGVPSGHSIAVKNGFFPLSGTARWRIGSTGFVRDDATGLGYAITIMTDGNPHHDAGQAVVEKVSRRVAAALTSGHPAPRAVDRSICTRTLAGEAWSQIAQRLGTNDAGGVQTVSGGPPSPHAGTRACRPDLAVVYDPDGPSARFVRAVWRTFLGRSPSGSELQTETTAIDARRSTRADLTHRLARSHEWNRRWVVGLYRSALGREPDHGGLAYWAGHMSRGLSPAAVGAYFYGSEEFFVRSGNSPSSFVAALYQEILHRSPDPNGHRYWVSTLASGSPTHGVAGWFYASIESRRERVQETYRRVLGRGPDHGGHGYWADQLLRIDDIELAAFLAASDEYYRRAIR